MKTVFLILFRVVLKPFFQDIIEIYTRLGEKVRHQLISSFQTRIDIHNLSSSVYFVPITTVGSSSTKKY